jgi:23S rRNA pseudouridine1911/1915/1917 synthase
MTRNQGYCYREVLGTRAAGHTVLSFLTRFYAHSTELQWSERLLAGEVHLDDRLVAASEMLRPGQVLQWHRPGWIEPTTPQDYRLVYHDEHLVVVDKPSGLPTNPGAGYFTNTLLSFVQADYPTARPLHRLGRATSGLVLFALCANAAAKLTQSWGQVRKQYQALASGIALEQSYDIRAAIGEQPHPRLGKVVAAHVDGKSARSVARTLQRREASTVFEVDLHTGRPHQIRIHLAFIGHPLVGDPLYAIGGVPRLDQPGLPGDAGYWLHAKRLHFTHPVSGHSLDLMAPLPEQLRCE